MDTHPWLFFILFLHMLRPRLFPSLLLCPVCLTPSQGQSSVLTNNVDDISDYQISDYGMLAGLSAFLHIVFMFHEELGRAVVSAHLFVA